MKKLIALALLVAGPAFASPPTIEIYQAVAPNTSSPSFTQWQANALYALQNGLSTYGDVSLPSYYQVLTQPVEGKQNITTTGFNSWNGVADPTGATSAERGSRLQFGTVIKGDGTISGKLSASMISNVNITDTNNELNTTFGAVTYNASLIGLDYGTDRIKGNGDDFTITSGSNTQVVDEIDWRGPGVSWLVNLSSPGVTHQDKLDNEIGLHFNTIISYSVTLDMPTGPDPTMGSSAVVIPEANTAFLALIGAGGVVSLRRRRR